MSQNQTAENWRDKIHEIIFEADTPLGKLFDVVLIVCIIASVLVVMLDSVDSIGGDCGRDLVAFWRRDCVASSSSVYRYCRGGLFSGALRPDTKLVVS